MIDFLLGVPGKLKTVIDHLQTYLSSTRCAKIDNLDTPLTSRAPASTALSTATWTPTKAGHIDAAITSRMASIKAIYRGTITVPFGAVSATATITSVDTAKSLIFNLGAQNDGTEAPNVRLELTNGTTITASKTNYSGTPEVIVGYQVIEFN